FCWISKIPPGYVVRIDPPNVILDRIDSAISFDGFPIAGTVAGKNHPTHGIGEDPSVSKLDAKDGITFFELLQCLFLLAFLLDLFSAAFLRRSWRFPSRRRASWISL